MTINPKLLDVIHEHSMNESESIFFCTFWWLKKIYPKAENLLLLTLADGSRIINLQKEEEYRINLLQHDEDGNLELRYPLFIEEGNKNFELFCKKLGATRLMNSNGHVNNPQDYAVYDISNETKLAFQSLPEFNIDKGVEVILNHYLMTNPAKKLSKYLKDNFWIDYQAYE